MTKSYCGYTLVQRRGARVDMYLGKKFVTWTLSLVQAKRLIDEMQLVAAAERARCSAA